MTWHHPSLGQRALDESDREIASLRERNTVLEAAHRQDGATIKRQAEEIERLGMILLNHKLRGCDVHAAYQQKLTTED